MHSLYVDSTAGLVIGLLDSDFKWVEYFDSIEKKPSEAIHYEIYNIVKRNNLNLKDMNFFFSAGPGSYTGMRLGEGIAQMLSWDGNRVFSFHHFDVPKMTGIPKGFWVTNAFKGQVFIYNWDESIGLSEKELVNSADFKIMNPELGFTLAADSKDFSQLKNTKDLIKNAPETVFTKVFAEKLREPPYYFRSLEEEFK